MGLVISLIFDSINSLSADILQAASPLMASLAQGIPALYSYASLANQALLPVGYTILSLFFLLDLVQCVSKVESAGGGTSMGIQMISGLLVKLALCKLLMDNVSAFMTGIFDSMAQITAQVARVVPISTAPTWLELDTAELMVLNLTIISGLPYLLLSLLVLLLVAFVWLRAQLMIYLRFIEAYLYLIVSPIPLATLPGGEWSQIGKNFIKSFVSVAIQGTLLYLTMAFYPVLVSSLSQSAAAVNDTILSALLQETFYALLLLFVLGGTTRLANSICSAM